MPLIENMVLLGLDLYNYTENDEQRFGFFFYETDVIDILKCYESRNTKKLN